MSDGVYSGGYWSDPNPWQNAFWAALTFGVAIAIGKAWERWRPRR